MSPAPLDRRDRWIGLGLFVATFVALLAGERTVGFVRDESVYFEAGRSYARWFQLLFAAPASAFSDAAIVRFWDFNHEHPPLMKVLFGLSHWLFHDTLGWLRPAAAFRVPAFATAALIPLLTYRMGTAQYGRFAGVFAAVAFVLVPRHFFNAELAAFDVPVAAGWLLVIYAYWRGQDSDLGWLWTGLAVGLTVTTKHNGLFLPFVILPFALQRAWVSTATDAEARRGVLRFLGVIAAGVVLLGWLFVLLGPQRFQDRIAPLSPHAVLVVGTLAAAGWLLFPLRRTAPQAFRALAPLWGMAVLTPVVVYVLWPYVWHHPVDRLGFWLAFHAQHNHYTWFYLGELLREPPFPLAYVVVKTALTVPVTIFVPMCLGFLVAVARGVTMLVPRWRDRLPPLGWLELLVLLNSVVSIAIISHPQVPHFGGVKHWLPSMPFLAIFAGATVARAASWARERLGTRVPAPAVAAALALLLWTPAAIALVRVHPYGTSFYGELAGGLLGAASLGMQRQFWSNNVTGVLPWINANASRGARVYLHEVNGYSFRDYQENGMLRPDLRPGGPFDAEVAAYQYHQEFREQEMNIWQAFGTTRPVHGLYVDETPQVVVYRRP